MTPFTTNNATWPAARLARLQRMEIQQAKRDVSAGRVERVCKPGVWRVFLVDGRTVGEVM